MKLFSKILFLYFFIFLTKSFSCNFNELNINKDISNLKIDEIFLINQDIDNYYGKYFFPIEAFCENKYQGIVIEIDTFEDKIFKISFFNQVSIEKKALEISNTEYSIKFNFENDKSNKKNLTREIKREDKYYYYTYLLNENNQQLEVFEIVDPKKNNSFRESENKEEQ